MGAMLSDLERELLVAGGRIGMANLRKLVGMGANRRFIVNLHGAGLLGVGKVNLSGARWEPEGPDHRLLIGVCDGGELVDVVAVSSTCRDEWALRTGLGWALGAGAIDEVHKVLASDMGEKKKRVRLRLHATPFDWLAAGGDGLCVLDWCAASLAELRGLGERVTLQVPPGGAERIKGLLAYGGLPRVSDGADGFMGRIAA